MGVGLLVVFARLVGVFIERAVVARREPPAVALVQQVQAAVLRLHLDGQVAPLGAKHLLVGAGLVPALAYALPEVAVDVLHVLALHVAEGQRAVVFLGVLLPLLGFHSGKEHLGQVLHRLLAGVQFLRHLVGEAVRTHVGLDVGLGQRVQRHPVGVALALRREGHVYAHPVLGLAVGVGPADDVAERVPGLAGGAGVVAHLLLGLEHDLLQVGNLPDADVDGGQRLAVGALRVRQRAHGVVLERVRRGAGADAGVGHVVVERGHHVHVVGGHHADGAAALLGLADGGLEGLVLVVVGHVEGAHQVAGHVPEALCLVHRALGLLGAAVVLTVVVVVLA